MSNRFQTPKSEAKAQLDHFQARDHVPPTVGMTAMNYETTSPTPSCIESHAVSEYVCWSRMQAEAGETLTTILERKEPERLAGKGFFLWGVGNAPAAAIRPLVRLRQQVSVVFSIMKTKAKVVDSSPERIVVWRRYFNAHGVEQPLPEHALVTSRGDSMNGAKKVHYALMCRTDAPLRLEHGYGFDHRAYSNASRAGAPVGTSQVTALLKLTGRPSDKAEYEVNLRAWLTESYWVRLSDPLELSVQKINALARCTEVPVAEWGKFVSELRKGEVDFPNRHDSQLHLF